VQFNLGTKLAKEIPQVEPVIIEGGNWAEEYSKCIGDYVRSKHLMQHVVPILQRTFNSLGRFLFVLNYASRGTDDKSEMVRYTGHYFPGPMWNVFKDGNKLLNPEKDVTYKRQSSTDQQFERTAIALDFNDIFAEALGKKTQPGQSTPSSGPPKKPRL